MALIAEATADFEPVAGKRFELRVTVTPRSPYTLSDYGTFTLTIRQDPEWPRTGSDRVAVTKGTVDPYGEGWDAAVTATGVVAGSVVTFTGTAPSDPGEDRYVYDVTAAGGAAGSVSVVDATWLTVKPSNVA